MKSLYLCIDAKPAFVAADTKGECIVATKFEIDAILKEQDLSGKKVYVVGNGKTSHDAAIIAYDNNRDAMINGEKFTIANNADDKLSGIEKSLLLFKLCNDSDWFTNALSGIVSYLVKKCPSDYSIRQVMQWIASSAPDLSIEGLSARRVALNEFKNQIRHRRAINKARISINVDKKKVIEHSLPREDAVDYVLNHPNPEEYVFFIAWEMNGRKTTKFTKPFFDKADAENKTLLMTSSITLTNSMCPPSDPRNYKKALGTGTIEQQSAIASTTNSAILSKSFAKFRESTSRVIFEEYESCRDSIISDIMGDGSLKARTEAQERFNELLNKKVVVCVDAHLSQHSADHILKTTGRKIIVLKASDVDAKKALPRVNYYFDRNTAVNASTEMLTCGQKVFSFCDAKHSGGKSKVRSTEIQITRAVEDNGEEIHSRLLDASFFAQKGNEHHLADLTSLYDNYDHIISTSALKNGCNIMSECDATLMLMHQTVLPLDVVQQSRRTRLSPVIMLNMRDSFRRYPVSEKRIFELELGKNIKEEDVDTVRRELRGNQATADIVDRITYLNEMRNDYKNNVLDIYHHMGYQISYNYDESCAGKEKGAARSESAERLRVYATLNRISQLGAVADIKAKDDEMKSLDEKRIEYANSVYNFYNIDAEDPNFRKVFKYDADGVGRRFINNLYCVRSGLDSDYFETNIREQILRKLFECLAVDTRTLLGQFTKSKCDEFKEWIDSASIELKDGTRQLVKNLFGMFFSDIKTTSSTWLVKNLLKEHLGLLTDRAKDEDGNDIRIKGASGKREYALCINAESISLTNFMYRLVHPSECEIMCFETFMKPVDGFFSAEDFVVEQQMDAIEREIELIE
jgi:hypothetical protein